MNHSPVSDWEASLCFQYLRSGSVNTWIVKPALPGKMLPAQSWWFSAATDDPNPASHVNLAGEPAATNQRKKPAVLLVEDNPADTLLIREALEEYAVDCDLTVVSDGEQAISMIQEIENTPEICPNLIILDLNLPKKSGREVLRRIRKSPECNHVPVAILSSSDAGKDREEAAQLGAIRYIRKPSSLDEFMKVGEILKGILFGFPN